METVGLNAVSRYALMITLCLVYDLEDLTIALTRSLVLRATLNDSSAVLLDILYRRLLADLLNGLTLLYDYDLDLDLLLYRRILCRLLYFLLVGLGLTYGHVLCDLYGVVGIRALYAREDRLTASTGTWDVACFVRGFVLWLCVGVLCFMLVILGADTGVAFFSLVAVVFGRGDMGLYVLGGGVGGV